MSPARPAVFEATQIGLERQSTTRDYLDFEERRALVQAPPCATCHDTGKWGVPGKPCPHCGLYTQKHVYPPKWQPKPTWLDVHLKPNRRERIAGLRGKGPFAYLANGPKPGYEE